MAYIIIPILYFLIIYILSWFYISHGNIAVLEMKIWIYWSEWILEYFYIVLKIKTEKFTCPNKVGLGPEDWCSSWGSWAGGLSGAHCEGLGPEDCMVLIVRILGLRTVWCSLWGLILISTYLMNMCMYLTLVGLYSSLSFEKCCKLSKLKHANSLNMKKAHNDFYFSFLYLIFWWIKICLLWKVSLWLHGF